MLNTSCIDPQLLYRRQYIAGPYLPKQFQSWRQVQLDVSTVVGCHSELEIAEVSNAYGRLLCLGHILDPSQYEQTNSQVLTSLLETAKDFASLEHRIGDFGGRWVMFVELHGKRRVYLDAGGLKSTFWYANPQSQEIWLGSQPSLFEESLGIAVDEEMVRQFWTTKYQSSWVCEVTPYPHVRQLLPNHYLDLDARSTHRFWPSQDVEPKSLDDAAGEMSEIIHGLIAAVAKRGLVALPLTGGYESRVTFSCAKELRNSLPLYLIDAPNTIFHDKLLSRKVAAKFGLKVSYLQPVRFGERYWNTFLRNTAEMYWDPGSNHIYTYGHHFPNHYLLIGQSNNATRAWYYKDGKQPAVIDPETLAKVTQYVGNPIALKAFDEWLCKAPKMTSISLLDLIFWEHRTGNWSSLCATAFDTVGCDMSSPYNCRKLMEIALGVDVEYRKPPHILLRRIAEITAGPDALSVPINYHWVEDAATVALRYVPCRIKNWVQTLRMKKSGVPNCLLDDSRFY